MVEDPKCKVCDVEVVHDKVSVNVCAEVGKTAVVNKVETDVESKVVTVCVDVETLVCVAELECCTGETCVLVV